MISVASACCTSKQDVSEGEDEDKGLPNAMVLNEVHLESQGATKKRGLRRWLPFFFKSRESGSKGGAEIPMKEMGLSASRPSIQVADAAEAEIDWNADFGAEIPVYVNRSGFLRHRDLDWEPRQQQQQQQPQHGQRLEVKADIEERHHIYERPPLVRPSFPPPSPPS